MHMHLSESEAAARFPELLERAGGGEVIVVERDGVPVCRLGPPGPACTLDAFRRFLDEHRRHGAPAEVSEAPQRLA